MLLAMLAQIWMNVPFTAIHFSAYEAGKRALGEAGQAEGLRSELLAGGLAGMLDSSLPHMDGGYAQMSRFISALVHVWPGDIDRPSDWSTAGGRLAASANTTISTCENPDTLSARMKSQAVLRRQPQRHWML